MDRTRPNSFPLHDEGSRCCGISCFCDGVLEENSGWIGHNGQIPGYFIFEVYNPELDATIVIAMNSDKKVNGEQGINVLLRDISKILFPNNPVNVPIIK